MNDKIQSKADQAILTLSQSLDQGKSETLKTYLTTMAKFHRYSWFNCMLIWLQKPNATHVAGFKKWLELGRCVKHGQSGIMILAPVIYRKSKAEKTQEETEQRETATNFTTAFVFDISQTEGRPLAALSRRTGNPGIYTERIVSFANSKGIIVKFAENLNGCLGLSRGGVIEVLSDLPAAEKFGVLVHEVCHEILHQGEHVGTKPKVVKELEAEATAFVVCTAIGLEDRSASADYIHLYQGDSQLLMASLASIQKASSMILKDILD